MLSVETKARLTTRTETLIIRDIIYFTLCYEGPEGVKWELGFVHFFAGKMGFHALGLGFINKKQ